MSTLNIEELEYAPDDIELSYSLHDEESVKKEASAPAPPAALLRGLGLSPKKVQEYQNFSDIEEEKETFLRSLPPLPLDCLSPQVREIIEGIAAAENVDTWMPFSVLLKSVCACVGASVLLKQRNKYNPAHLWIVLAALSGSGKSDVNRYIFSAIEDAQYEQHKNYKEEVAQYKKEMIKYNSDLEAASKDKSRSEPEEPKKPFSVDYYVNDITEESLLIKFRNNPQGMLWDSDEFSSWLKSMDRYKKVDSGQKGKVLGFYGGAGFSYDRVKNENVTESVRRAWLSIYGTIQPDILAKAFSEEDFENGFLQRMTFIFAEEIEETDPDDDPDDDENFVSYDSAPATKIIKTMLEWPRLAPDSENSAILAELWPASSKLLRKCFFKNYIKYKNFGTFFEKTRAKRWRAQISRLILCLHCLERAAQGAPNGGGMISEKTVENGIKIFEALIEHSIEAERRIKQHMKKNGRSEETFTISNLDFVKNITDLFDSKNEQFFLDYNEKVDGIKKIDILKKRLAGDEMSISTQKVTKSLEGLGFIKNQISTGIRMTMIKAKFQKILDASEKWENDKKNRQGTAKAIVPF